MPEYDVVIIGGGFAGLLVAVHLSGLRVAIIHSDALGAQTSSERAQGGVAAAVGPGDDPELHARDTIQAGAGLSDPEVVWHVTTRGPAIIGKLETYGVRFDRAGNDLKLKHEAAHSLPRVVSAQGANTGAAIMKAMVERVRELDIELLEGWKAQRLLRNGERVVGVTIEQADRKRTITAAAVVLATGSPCGLWRDTSVPAPSTGNGLAMAADAGARLSDLEFVQFHPTCLNVPDSTILLTEALRGAGAQIVDSNGVRFVLNDHADGELAPRDVVARSVFASHEQGRGAFLDLKPIQNLRVEFPSVFALAHQHGSDLVLPIKPGAHFHMGGISTDLAGRTGIAGLWAVGEVACTGLHGANRLASNSLLEIAVTAPQAAADVRQTIKNLPYVWSDELGVERSRCRQIDLKLIQETMNRYVGVVRTPLGLQHALGLLRSLPDSNESLVARLIAEAALHRRVSIGAHQMA
jgi:L-aspartate oxidase